MSAPRSFFDVVVLGGSLGALSAAALLCRRGFRVACLRQGARSNVYRHDGLPLLRRPEALTFLEGPAWQRIVAELALGSSTRRRTITPALRGQLVLPKHRLDLHGERTALFDEFAREFPDVRRACEELLTNATDTTELIDGCLKEDAPWPPDGFFERFETGRITRRLPFDWYGNARDPLASLPEGHPLRTALTAPLRFALCSDPDRATMLPIVRARANWLRGAGYFEGGRDALATLLEEKIQQLGGELRPRDRASRIITHRGRIEAIEIDTTEELLGCAFVLADLSPAETYRLAGHAPSDTCAEALLRRAPRYFRYTVNVVVPVDAVPMGMGRRLVSVADLQRPLAEENLLEIERTEGSIRRGTQDCTVLTVTALLPRAGVEEGPMYLSRQRKRVLQSLEKVVPFLSEQLLLVDSPHDGLALEDVSTGVALQPSERWNAEPEAMRTLDAIDSDAFLGLAGNSVRSELKQLFLLGEHVLPGLGEEGELLAALTAARIVTKSDPDKERLRRALWG